MARNSFTVADILHYDQCIKECKSYKEYCEDYDLDYKSFMNSLTKLRNRGFIRTREHPARCNVSMKYNSLEIPMLPSDVREKRHTAMRFVASGKSKEEWCADNSVPLESLEDAIEVCKQNGITFHRILQEELHYTGLSRETLESVRDLNALELEWLLIITDYYENGDATITDWCDEKGLDKMTFFRYRRTIESKGYSFESCNTKMQMTSRYIEYLNHYYAWIKSGERLFQYTKRMHIDHGNMQSALRYLIKRGIDLSKTPYLIVMDGKSFHATPYEYKSKQVYDAYMKSGKSMPEYCKSAGISLRDLVSMLNTVEKTGLQPAMKSVRLTVPDKDKLMSRFRIV